MDKKQHNVTREKKEKRMMYSQAEVREIGKRIAEEGG